MILAFHIFFALTSLVYTTILYARPEAARFAAAYLLAATTLISGTYLIVISGSALLKSCVIGIAYMAVIAAQIIGARRRLSAVRVKNDSI
jgi:ABC-type transport system involved in cytochrome bd biosynthesis fused ATPase/permease subunit